MVARIRTEGLGTLARGLKKVDKQIVKTSNKLNILGKKMVKLGTGITKLTAPIAVLGAAMGVLSVKTGQYADKLLDLQQITGLSTDTLQEFEHVAREAGVDFDGLVGIISKFQGRIPQLVSGTGESAKAL